jgi:hypothetical protein
MKPKFKIINAQAKLLDLKYTKKTFEKTTERYVYRSYLEKKNYIGSQFMTSEACVEEEIAWLTSIVEKHQKETCSHSDIRWLINVYAHHVVSFSLCINY